MVNEMLTDRALKEITLVKRHIEILNLVHKEEPIGIMKISETLKMPTHKVRYSLRILEKEGLIVASSEGAKVTYTVPEEIKKIEKELDKQIEIINEIKSRIKLY